MQSIGGRIALREEEMSEKLVCAFLTKFKIKHFLLDQNITV